MTQPASTPGPSRASRPTYTTKDGVNLVVDPSGCVWLNGELLECVLGVKVLIDPNGTTLRLDLAVESVMIGEVPAGKPSMPESIIDYAGQEEGYKLNPEAVARRQRIMDQKRRERNATNTSDE